jgi:hypothetical protein
MTATGIAPQPWRMVFAPVSLLDQQFPLGAEDKNGKGPVQGSIDMDRYFIFAADLITGFINQNNPFLHNILLTVQIWPVTEKNI